MTNSRTIATAGYAIAALVVVASTVLAGLHVAVPGWFESLAIFAAGGATGAIVPGEPKPPSPPPGMPHA